MAETLNIARNRIEIVADGDAAVVRIVTTVYIQRRPMREQEVHLQRSELRAYLHRVIKNL